MRRTTRLACRTLAAVTRSGIQRTGSVQPSDASRDVARASHTASSAIKGTRAKSIWQKGGAIDLKRFGADTFQSQSADLLWKPAGARGVYGGQVIGQALEAARHTVSDTYVSCEDDEQARPVLHSMHAYFLKGGNNRVPIDFQVHRLLDGRSFASRAVTASQDGVPICHLQTSFHRPEPYGGRPYAVQMPEVPGPEGLVNMHTQMVTASQSDHIPDKYRAILSKALESPFPVDVRRVDQTDPFALPEDKSGAFGEREAEKPRQQIWMKALGDLGDDVNLHRTVAAWASDWGLAATSLLHEGLRLFHPRVKVFVSLDHAMWFHDSVSFRADEWLLYDMETTHIGNARALSTANVFNQDGELKFTVTQENLMRLQPPNAPNS